MRGTGGPQCAIAVSLSSKAGASARLLSRGFANDYSARMSNGLRSVLARNVDKRTVAACVIGCLAGAGVVTAFYAPALRAESRLADKYFDMYLDAPTSGDINQAKADLAEAEEDLAEAEGDLEEREDSIESTEDDLAAREKRVATAEAKQKGKTVPGEGTYEVGVDIKSGTYRAPAASGCYWAINADPNGDRIISNGNTDGQFVVSVKDGQFLEVARCAELVRQ